MTGFVSSVEAAPPICHTFIYRLFNRLFQETPLTRNGLTLSLTIASSQLQVLSQRKLRIVADAGPVEIWGRELAKVFFIVVSKLPINRSCTGRCRSCPGMTEWLEVVLWVDRRR